MFNLAARSVRSLAPRAMAVTAARAASTMRTRAATSSRTPLAIGSMMVGASVVAGGVVYASTEATVDVAALRAAVVAVLEEDINRGPTLVRLAWHQSGTFCAKTMTGGSSSASMRFVPECNHGANAGLQGARDWLEPVKQQFPEVSYSDLWIFAANVAIEEMGGPELTTRFGRVDAANGDACPPDGRLPDASKAETHIRDVFHRMGYSDRELVALIGGGHSIGRCHPEASGYTGPWTFAPTTVSNLYFKELLDNTWTKKKWDGPEQFEDPTGELMMLPSDMAFLFDADFRKLVVEYANDEEVFMKDFASAWTKLTEFNCKFPSSKKGLLGLGFLGL